MATTTTSTPKKKNAPAPQVPLVPASLVLPITGTPAADTPTPTPETPAPAPAVEPTAPTPEQAIEDARVRLVGLAVEAREASAELGGLLKRAVSHARTVGDILATAKGIIQTDKEQLGTFAEWLERERVGLTEQTANRYIRVASGYDRMQAAGYEATSIEDAAEWVRENPDPNGKKETRGGANNHKGPTLKKLPAPDKRFFTPARLQKAAAGRQQFLDFVNQMLEETKLNIRFE